ncbi:MAG TPA: gliding motility-associated C-terminal domain-containing protein [Ignavibacteriaceae bacterium]|nr:gliding motility-associated C-terminal domain-containing protein [Ignavibacteriaceae bacterium]
MRIRTYLLIITILSVCNIFPQSSLIDTTFHLPSQVDSVNSFSVDYKSTPGSLQIEVGEKENLALKRYAFISFGGTPPADTARKNPFKLIDGLKTGSFVEFPSENVGGRSGSYIIIDLQAVRRVKRVLFFSLGGNINTRVRAFTIYAGMDTTGIGMEKVYVEPDNPVANPEAVFTPVTARYVKIVLDVISTTSSTVISEIEVYGEGYLPVGVFVSSVRKLEKNVNFGAFEFEAEKPTGTQIYYSVRTGDTPAVDSTWSPWSDSSDVSNSFYTVYEPRGYVQYKMRLETSTLETPKVHKVIVNYDTNNVAYNTDAYISPQYAQILSEQTFTLTIDCTFNPNDYGIDTIVVFTPAPSQFQELRLNGVKQTVQYTILGDRIIIVMGTTLKTDAKIEILLKTSPYLAINPFRTIISSKLKNNPQRVNSKVTDQVDAWSIITVGVPEKIVIGGKATPNPFTPNGDGVNDKTKIEFFVGNIAQPPSILGKEVRAVTVKIYDTTGKLIRDLLDLRTSAYAYIAENSIEWDGRDESGKIVRPGLYIYQIFINSDNGGEYVTRTVVVSY